MLTQTPEETWSEFLAFIEEKSSATEFANWFAPIKVIPGDSETLVLEVPNIFVQEYLLDNYREDLAAFLGTESSGKLPISFVIAKKEATKPPIQSTPSEPHTPSKILSRVQPISS